MSLILTRTQNLRANSPGLYKWEDKASELGALDFFMQDTDAIGGILSSDLQKKAQESIGSTLQAPVLKFNSGITISSTRSVTISDAFNTSAMVNFTFVTYSWGWTETPSAHHNNEIKLREDWNFSYLGHLHAVGKLMDTACVTALDAAKTQVWGNALGYDTTGNIITVDQAKRKRIIADISPIMASNDVYGPIHLIGNRGLQSLALEIMESSLYNNVNNNLQLMDKTIHFTNRIADDVGMEATFYAVNRGSVGLLYRFEREALYQPKTETSHKWGIDRLIGLDIPVSTYEYEGVGDYSADHGAATSDNTRAWKRFFGFSIDVCYVTAYNSSPTTIASPIAAVQISET